MKIGLQVNRFNWPGGPEEIGARLAQIASTADESDFASVWVMDHLFQIRGLGPPEDPMLEAYTTLGYLAGVTQNVTLGTLVTAVVYRHPGVLVKTVTTLDVISGGRAYLGIGAAWFEREAVGLGIPFPELKRRFEILEETLQAAHVMWADDVSAYEGEHLSLEEPINHPPAVSRPHPPILIGGAGEKKTLRLVAKYGDACNLFARAGADVLRHKLNVLRDHCKDVGRDYREIEKTVLLSVDLTDESRGPEQVIKSCRDLAEVGFQHVMISMPNTHEIWPLETLAEKVIPAVAELEASGD